MNRKILLIIGKSDTTFPGKYAFKSESMIETLKERDDIDLEVVGDYKADKFDKDELYKAISSLDPNQLLTIIVLSHGGMSGDSFNFIMDSDTKLSSKELFTLIKSQMQDSPVDIFTQACHGGGMIKDKDILPSNSTVVSLTTLNMENNGIDFDKFPNALKDFSEDLTAYNLLQIYISKCLKNRFDPQIGYSGGYDYSLDNLLKLSMSNSIKFDKKHFEYLGCPDNYEEVYEKIVSNSSDWSINASEYGIALSIVLNDFNNKRLNKGKII